VNWSSNRPIADHSRSTVRSTFLWERFADEVDFYRPNPKKKGPRPFAPERLANTIGDIFKTFNEGRPGKPRFKPHDLRSLALTTATLLHGVDEAALAIGVDPQTARRYYIDATKAHDMDAVYASLAERWRFGGGGEKPEGVETAITPGN
jgi:hypothetical protein